MDIGWLDVSSTIGLCAMIALTLNILFGMMLGTAYKRSGYWQKLPARIKKISINDVHNWTAYVALVLAILHPLLLLVDKTTKFTLVNVLFPIRAPHQRLFVFAGTLALYALCVTIITTQKVIRKKLTFRVWKNIHLISYATALLFLFHGLFMDPELKDRPVDWLDGEKLLCEFCILVIVLATISRYRYYLMAINKKQRAKL